MSLHVARIDIVQLTDTNTGGGSEDSSILLFLEDGPNGFDGLRHIQGNATGYF